ncbi:hypothetical protein HGM15179_021234 [Zosterops borbonicus]|uniref:Charged multivesicular body protein 1b n=1 Tax=Zosterops borbonicus TaxID=364589 RepID=A0A8K1FTF2_9PASS|nr:hypothetical protein HGM15179_021234 [Zosterops borbonicus]
MEVARIHAENAIRQKNQAINFLRMSARVDAVAARVQTAVTMGKVTKSMAGVVKSMDATLKSMNLEKISALMDKFEHQFETLDVQTQQMEDTMSNTTTLTTPQFAAKELNRNSKKCDKEEKAEKAKIKKAIQKGNMEVARIHAENAIRQKNQAINFLRMSARVDAVAARVQTAVTMGKVTKSMAGVVKSMDATLKSMNLEKISALMDKFEHQFETLDVQTQQMEDTMSNTTTLTTPQNQVDMLLQEMADEAGLDLNMELPQGQTGSVGTSVASAEQVNVGFRRD